MRLWSSLLLLLLLVTPATAEMRVFGLEHRAPSEILGAVCELLDEGEKAQAVGSQLLVVADHDTLKAVAELIRLFDRQPRQFIIRLQQLWDKQRGSYEISGAGSKDRPSRHLGNTMERNEQRLRVREGGSGRLEIGRAIPYTEEWAAYAGDISGYAEKTAYLTLRTGFFVSPRQLVGERVYVHIEPYLNRAGQVSGTPLPEVKFSSLRTETYLPLGRWVTLGEQLNPQDGLGRLIVSRPPGKGPSRQVFLLRIDQDDGFSP